MLDSTFDYRHTVPDVMGAFARTQETLDAQDLDRMLRHLVMLRASQINGCAFCVKMHTREARDDGETNERLDHVIVWRHVDDYTPAEAAALAWTEALTTLDPATDLAALRADLQRHFTPGQIGALTATVAMINLWNRIAISTH